MEIFLTSHPIKSWAGTPSCLNPVGRGGGCGDLYRGGVSCREQAGDVSGGTDRRLARDNTGQGGTIDFHAESKVLFQLGPVQPTCYCRPWTPSLSPSCTWRGTLTLNLQPVQRCKDRKVGGPTTLAGTPEPQHVLLNITASYLHSSSLRKYF